MWSNNGRSHKIMHITLKFRYALGIFVREQSSLVKIRQSTQETGLVLAMKQIKNLKFEYIFDRPKL